MELSSFLPYLIVVFNKRFFVRSNTLSILSLSWSLPVFVCQGELRRQPFGYGLIGPLYHRGKVLIMCADTFGLMADSSK